MPDWKTSQDYGDMNHKRPYLRFLQEESQKWREHSFPPENRTVELQVLGVAEEAGELAHAILKRKQGIRGDSAYHVGQAADAVGDIIIYLAGVCTSLDLDMQTCVDEAWREVAERDWSKHKAKGVE
jgi:NTP pyrophosphatase (non-canonical NTP hydrolase)